MQPNELNALISLLDDPDEQIFTEVKSKIVSLGTEIIPMLENVWEHSFDQLLQTRIENIIHTIQFQKSAEDLRIWVQNGELNLYTAAMMMARYQYPDLDERKVRKQLDVIKHDVWLEINDNLTALEKTKVLNHILFDVHHLSGNTTNYYAPQNCFINDVLETKKGNPLSISIVYMIIAQELNIPIYGVNLPEHFVLAYKDDTATLPADSNRVLFYINAFSKGAIFSRREIDAFLSQLKQDAKPEFYSVCSTLDIIKRLITNLSYAYQKLGYTDKVDELKSLEQVLLLNK